MSSEFYCRWGSTAEFLYILKKYLKNWGSNVVGVLLSLEFYGQHPDKITKCSKTLNKRIA